MDRRLPANPPGRESSRIGARKAPQSERWRSSRGGIVLQRSGGDVGSGRARRISDSARVARLVCTHAARRDLRGRLAARGARTRRAWDVREASSARGPTSGRSRSARKAGFHAWLVTPLPSPICAPAIPAGRAPISNPRKLAVLVPNDTPSDAGRTSRYKANMMSDTGAARRSVRGLAERGIGRAGRALQNAPNATCGTRRTGSS